jgi:secreted trypsin-like serine protease
MNTRSIFTSVSFRAMNYLTLVTAIFIVVLAKAGDAKKHRQDSNSNVTHRVAGSEEVIPHSLPFQAFLEINNRDGLTRTCSGALITPRTVLTNANCVYTAKSVDVILGAHNHKIYESCQQRQTVPDVNIRRHRGYTPSTPDDDIALLILGKPAKIVKCVQTVELPTGCAFEMFVDEPGTISGWGQTNDDPHSVSDTLMSVTQPIISNKECGKQFGVTYSDRRICADGSGGKAICYGDGGAPLTVNRNFRYTVVGISSWKYSEGCQKGYPSGFTRVTSFLDWIAENAKN